MLVISFSICFTLAYLSLVLYPAYVRAGMGDHTDEWIGKDAGVVDWDPWRGILVILKETKQKEGIVKSAID